MDKINDRALPDFYFTLRGGGIQWNAPRHGLDLVVKQCAEEANKKGYEYFGVQNYGECYGNGMNYAKHGDSNNCDMYDEGASHGVGKSSANFVYRLNKVMLLL